MSSIAGERLRRMESPTHGALSERSSPCQVASIESKSLWPYELQPTRLLCPWGFSRQEYWSGLPCPPPGGPPDPGIEPASSAASALAGGLFATSITWKPRVVSDGDKRWGVYSCLLKVYEGRAMSGAYRGREHPSLIKEPGWWEQMNKWGHRRRGARSPGDLRLMEWPLAVASRACWSCWRIWAEERSAVPCELSELAWLLHFELMEGFPGQKQGNWLGGSIDKLSERWWGLGPKWNKDVVRSSQFGDTFLE